MTPGLLLWVAFAGGAGAVARWAASEFVARRLASLRTGHPDGDPGWPAGSTVVNLAGALAAGCLMGVGPPGRDTLSPLATVATVGFLGAFTTFSTWMVEVVDLWQDGRRPAAALHLLGTLAAGLLLGWLGFRVAGGR